MSLTLVTAPTSEPVSLSEMKSHMRLDGNDDDSYVTKCIKAARLWIEGQTKRALVTQTVDYAIDSNWPMWNGHPMIRLPLNPVKSIGATSPEVFSISYVDSNGATQTLAQSQYTLAARSHGSYVVPAYGVTWPSVRDVPEAITVRFVAGADTVDEDLKIAVKILASYYYENRETSSGAPRAVEALISPYRSVLL